MTVTDVTPQKKNTSRVNVFADGKYLFSMDEVDAVNLGIKKGAELTEDELALCLKYSGVAKAKDKALDIISHKAVTRKMLFDLLLQKGFSAEDITDVCDELENLGYIDDYAFAQLFMEYAEQKMWGTRKIRYELMQKGVSADIAEDVLSEFELPTPEKLAGSIIAKYGASDLSDIKVRQKITRYYAARGFDFDIIKSALSISKGMDNSDDE